MKETMSEQSDIAETGLHALPPYNDKVSWWGHYTAMLGLSTMLLVRRRRLLLAAVITMLPIFFPLSEAYLGTYAQMGGMFPDLNRDIYLPNLAPILALFFAAMLIGEDLEAQTMPYFLTRPLPRSMWVLGKFTAYLIVAGGLIVVSQWLSFLACTMAPNFGIDRQNLILLAHYNAVAFLAVLGNGAVALFLGVITKRPIVLGVLVLILWQRLAAIIPGAVDFFTINKYIEMIAPQSLGATQDQSIQTALGEIAKQQLYISAGEALPALLAISAGFILATIVVLRVRQFE